MKKTLLLVIVATTFLSGAANARSCTEQGQACSNWAKTNVPDADRSKAAQGVCRAEIPKCIARCKQGQKYFVGISGSQTYPIETCR